MDLKRHWENVYATRKPTDVSWFQAEARRSLELIRRMAPEKMSTVLDVGGGASTLVDGLLRGGYRDVTVLDVSPSALAQAQSRLGREASEVRWREADILTTELAEASIDVWHDRAVFHFLTNPLDRRRYVEQVRHAVRPGGIVLVATFAEDGPTHCSDLQVARYNAETLHAEFGDSFRLLANERESHITPSGAEQKFIYCVYRFEETFVVTAGGRP